MTRCEEVVREWVRDFGGRLTGIRVRPIGSDTKTLKLDLFEECGTETLTVSNTR